MRITNIESDEVARLLDEIVERTGETEVDAVKHALQMRLDDLRSRDAAVRTLAWLRASVWPSLPGRMRGKAPTEEEQEELLGCGFDRC